MILNWYSGDVGCICEHLGSGGCWVGSWDRSRAWKGCLGFLVWSHCSIVTGSQITEWDDPEIHTWATGMIYIAGLMTIFSLRVSLINWWKYLRNWVQRVMLSVFSNCVCTTKGVTYLHGGLGPSGNTGNNYVLMEDLWCHFSQTLISFQIKSHIYLNVTISSRHIWVLLKLLPSRSHDLFCREFQSSPSVDRLPINTFRIMTSSTEYM